MYSRPGDLPHSFVMCKHKDTKGWGTRNPLLRNKTDTQFYPLMVSQNQVEINKKRKYIYIYNEDSVSVIKEILKY